MNEKWFSLSVDEIEKKLRTNVASGLSLKAAKARTSRDSAFFKVRKKNIGLLIVELFYDFFNLGFDIHGVFSFLVSGIASLYHTSLGLPTDIQCADDGTTDVRKKV